jgi:hypothetical protein
VHSASIINPEDSYIHTRYRHNLKTHSVFTRFHTVVTGSSWHGCEVRNDVVGPVRRGFGGRGVKLTTYLYIMPKLRKGGANLHYPIVFLEWCLGTCLLYFCSAKQDSAEKCEEMFRPRTEFEPIIPSAAILKHGPFIILVGLNFIIILTIQQTFPKISFSYY